MGEQLKISIIIVNYNVEYFLEQCLNSVFTALKGIPSEVFVVDNDSIDQSMVMVKEKFPQVNLIENNINVGFSKANNQAIALAKGEYVLLLNPDTVVEEDTFSKCIYFMDDNPTAGGLGVRMIDGKGRFLPESKRGLPTPAVAFYKIFGISRLFPKSKIFGRYHLGYLNEFETNEIEILSGAFMFMRKEALDKVGVLDEAFFMYGEDIDLSYRIVQGGYKNYYYPETQIIHYKGESTKKSSVNYVFVFYRAMIIFAQKHFSQKNAKLFSFLINSAIYFRAGLALLNRFVKRAFLPIVDFTFILLGLFSLGYFWKQENITFPEEVIHIAIPSYTLIWMISVYFLGGYDKPIRLINFLKGGFLGTALILMIYALLPKDWQFSRLYILIGFLAVVLYYILSRLFLHVMMKGRFDLSGVATKRFGVVGSLDEIKRVIDILDHSAHKVEDIISIAPSRSHIGESVGAVEQLDQIVHIHKLNEIIFCAKDVSAETIMQWMSKITSNEVEFKIAQPDSIYLIGSNSVDTAGDLYVMDIDKITKVDQQRNKRLLDILGSSLLLILFPFLVWGYKNKTRFFKNCWCVLIGKISFVGYQMIEDQQELKLPRIKKGILSPAESHNIQQLDTDLVYKLNLIYARDYTVFKDLEIMWKNWRKLDR